MGHYSYKVPPPLYRNPLGKVLNDWLMYSYDPMTKKKKKKKNGKGEDSSQFMIIHIYYYNL